MEGNLTMTSVYEDISTLIPNTTMQRVLVDGVCKVYTIKANDGYVLHDNSGDWAEFDCELGEEVTKFAYYTAVCSCSAKYDFEANQRDFHAVKITDVPSTQIF